VLAFAGAACASSEQATTTDLSNRAAGGPARVAFRATKVGVDDDGEDIIGMTFSVNGHVLAHDELYCSGEIAEHCQAGADARTSVYITCGMALSYWQAELVPGAIAVSRVETFFEGAPDHETVLARIPTLASSLVLTP
jgi:hypothetical protein